MKRITFICLLAVGIFGTAFSLAPQLQYTENSGQWDDRVLFKADLHGAWVFLERNELTYLFMEAEKMRHAHHDDVPKYIEQDGQKIPNPAYTGHEGEVIKGHVYKMSWEGANPAVQVAGSQSFPGYSNYFLGNDESKWASNVLSYGKVTYTGLYNNIDLQIYSNGNAMKSDYIVHKNGRVQDIRIEYKGADGVHVDAEGRLQIATSVNTVTEFKPYAYQVIDGEKKEVRCGYVLIGNTVSFNLPDGYDEQVELVIDPTLVFSTYSGSSADNWGSSATHDNNGNMFLGGIALEPGYPTTTGAFQTGFGGGSGGNPSDVVITKFTANGSTRLYSTHIGGSSNELLSSLYCTPANELICLMTTSSTNFPTSANGYDKTHNGGSSTSAIDGSITFPNGADIAIVKLNAAGSALVGSTYFGGAGQDGLNINGSLQFNYGDDTRGDIGIDDQGNIYITGTTTSGNLPGTAGKLQPDLEGSSDGVVAKFNSTLSSLTWATYYGGTNADGAYTLQLDNAGNIFIAGGTLSTNLPGTSNGLHPTSRGGVDGFVAKMNNAATAVSAATYLGTTAYDQAFVMDLDNSNNVYIFGQTLGAYPVSAGVYSNAGSKQFIHKLNNNLNTTGYSTVFGRANYQFVNISPTALLVDICGSVYAVGWGGGINFSFQLNAGTTAQMPVTANAFDPGTDGDDFYMINLSANGTSLIYATYFGENGGVGDHVDGGTSRFDKNGIVYQAVCASCGGSNGFPTSQGAYSNDNNSFNCNMAGVKFQFDLQGLQVITVAANPPSGCAPLNTSFTYTATKPGTTFFWDFGDGTSSTAEFPSHTYNNPGTYTVKFVIRNPQDCNPADSATLTVTVGQRATTNLVRSICQGQSVTIGNQTFTQTGNYSVTFPGTNGCDSVVNLNLTVNPVKTTNLVRNICTGQSVTIGNQTFTQTGNYIVVLQTSAGCDSTVNLNLTVTSVITTNLVREICQGESVTIGNQTFNQTGNYSVTLNSPSGCDSVVNLALTVHPDKTSNISETICQGDTVKIGNQAFTQTGNYTVGLQTSKGCDSTVNLSLTVNPEKTTNLSETFCEGGSITIGNQTFTQTGNYTVVLLSSLRCDSTVNLSLTVNPNKITNLVRTICPQQSVTIGNQTFNQAGNYTVVLQTSAGCDSTVNLDLSVSNILVTNLVETICEGASFTVGSSTYTQTGIYTDTINITAGCDSVVNLELTVLPRVSARVIATVCEGETVFIGNQAYTQTGVYTDTIQAVNGCDSIVTLELTVNSLPDINAISDKAIADSGTQVQLDVVTTETLNYNWTPGNILTDPALQNPVATIHAPTWFVVTAVNPQTGCEETDSVFVDVKIYACDAQAVFIPNAFSPNGDGINDIFVPRTQGMRTGELIVYDRWGVKVFETSDITLGWDGRYKNEWVQADAYGYYFIGECQNGDKIELKGNVSVLK